MLEEPPEELEGDPVDRALLFTPPVSPAREEVCWLHSLLSNDYSQNPSVSLCLTLTFILQQQGEEELPPPPPLEGSEEEDFGEVPVSITNSHR